MPTSVQYMCGSGVVKTLRRPLLLLLSHHHSLPHLVLYPASAEQEDRSNKCQLHQAANMAQDLCVDVQ